VLAALALLAPAFGHAAGWRTFVREAEPVESRVPPVLAETDPQPMAEVDTPSADTERDGVADPAVEVTAAEVGEDETAADATGPCGEEDAACRDALRQIRDDSLSDIDLDIRVSGQPGNDYPCECRLEGETFEPRRFATTTFTWKAAGYCHKPLYFEDWQLERYGHSHGPLADPFFSAAHFFTTLPVLPYKMGVELPWECVYPLGYYRPGNCAPWTVPAIPISVRGMAVEAATVTGLVFLFP